MTEKQQQMFKAVNESDYCNLFDVYKSFSTDKYNAFNYCLRECARLNGFNFRITSTNTFHFSCGFLYYDENKRLRCRYYTGRNTYDFIVE